MAVLMEVKEMNKKHQEEIIKLSSKVIVLEKENIVLKKEFRSLKESANRHEQATRILTVRILGMPVTTEESSSAPADRNKVAVSTAYENIIKPILVAAKEKKIINAVPQQKTAIIDGFRLKSSATDKNGRPYPPPIIIRFTEKIFRQEGGHAQPLHGGSLGQRLPQDPHRGGPHPCYYQEDEGAQGG